jgi:hypothetical protein
MTRYSTDGEGTSERHSNADTPRVGKDKMQTIASIPLHVRTRSTWRVRRTSCVAKTERRRDLVIALCINRYECGRAV